MKIYIKNSYLVFANELLILMDVVSVGAVDFALSLSHSAKVFQLWTFGSRQSLIFLLSSASFYFVQLSLKMSKSWRHSKVTWLLFGSSSAHMSRVDTSATHWCEVQPVSVQHHFRCSRPSGGHWCVCVFGCLDVRLKDERWASCFSFEVKWSEVKWMVAVRWAKKQSDLRHVAGVVTALHTFRSNKVSRARLVNKAAAGRLRCQNNCSGGSLNAPLSEISFCAGQAWTRKKHSSGSWRSWVTVQPCFVDAVSKPVKVTERSHVFTGSRKNKEKHDKRNSDPFECG